MNPSSASGPAVPEQGRVTKRRFAASVVPPDPGVFADRERAEAPDTALTEDLGPGGSTDGLNVLDATIGAWSGGPIPGACFATTRSRAHRSHLVAETDQPGT